MCRHLANTIAVFIIRHISNIPQIVEIDGDGLLPLKHTNFPSTVYLEASPQVILQSWEGI